MPLMRGRGRAGAGGAGSWSSRTPTGPRRRPPRCGNRLHPRPLPSLALAISTWSRTGRVLKNGAPRSPSSNSTYSVSQLLLRVRRHGRERGVGSPPCLGEVHEDALGDLAEGAALWVRG